jgi:hypothetical protein
LENNALPARRLDFQERKQGDYRFLIIGNI